MIYSIEHLQKLIGRIDCPNHIHAWEYLINHPNQLFTIDEIAAAAQLTASRATLINNLHRLSQLDKRIRFEKKRINPVLQPQICVTFCLPPTQ